MKKVFIFLALILTVIPFFVGCSCKNNSLNNNVSQIRSDIFKGSSQNFVAEAYSEIKEFPFITDCHVGDKKTCVIIKIKDCSLKNLSAQIEFSNSIYKSNLTYNNVSNTLTATIIVKSLPKNSLTLTIISPTDKESFMLTSVKKDNILSPANALKSVVQKEKDFINSLYDSGVFKSEIYIRLLAEGDYNFYYIGFADKNNKISAFLLDATSGKIIAGKDY